MQFAQIDQYDDGSQSFPDINQQIFDMEDRPIAPETYVESSFGSEALAALTSLRSRLIEVLQGLGIALLSAEDAAQPVPWLKAGEDLLVANAWSDAPLTVQEAFFFQVL